MPRLPRQGSTRARRLPQAQPSPAKTACRYCRGLDCLDLQLEILLTLRAGQNQFAICGLCNHASMQQPAGPYAILCPLQARPFVLAAAIAACFVSLALCNQGYFLFHLLSWHPIFILAGTQWTSIERQHGWRHFRVVEKRRDDKKATHVLMASTCDKEVRFWVSCALILWHYQHGHTDSASTLYVLF